MQKRSMALREPMAQNRDLICLVPEEEVEDVGVTMLVLEQLEVCHFSQPQGAGADQYL